LGIFCILVFIIMRDLIRKILLEESRKWTKEKVLELASQYTQMNHFKKDHPQAYQAAGRNGWLDDVRVFMTPKYKTWTKEEAHKEALKYQHPDQFQTNSNAAYQAASYHGWLPDITSHMTNVQTRWTDESIWETALKYETKRDFIKNDYGAYQAATKRGILNDVTGHMRIVGNILQRHIYVYEFPDKSVYVGLSFDTKERDKRHRTKEKSQVFKYIQNTGLSPEFKVLTEKPIPAKDAQTMEDETIKMYRENGWNVLNIAKAGGLGSTVLEKITKEDVMRIASQYTTKTKFCKEQQRVCNVAKRMGWYDEATAHMEVKNIMWTIDMLRDEALKYNTRNEFRQGSPNAHKAASSRGILDDITKHMGEPKKNQYGRSWVNNKESASIEASKYFTIKELRKNDPGLYNAILK